MMPRRQYIAGRQARSVLSRCRSPGLYADRIACTYSMYTVHRISAALMTLSGHLSLLRGVTTTRL